MSGLETRLYKATKELYEGHQPKPMTRCIKRNKQQPPRVMATGAFCAGGPGANERILCDSSLLAAHV